MHTDSKTKEAKQEISIHMNKPVFKYADDDTAPKTMTGETQMQIVRPNAHYE